MSRTSILKFLFYLALFFPQIIAQDNPACYWPDGTIATDNYPCDPTGEITVACCVKSDFCLQNNVCLGSSGGMWRASCTDKSWKDGRCSGARDCNSVFTGQADMIYHCGRGTDWACDRTGNGAAIDCRDNFTLSGPWDILLRPDQLPSASVTGAIILDPSSGLIDLPVETVTVTTTPPVRFSTTSTVAVASGTTSSNNEGTASKNNVGAIAGGTVGGVAGLAILGIGIWFLVSRRAKSKKVAASEKARMGAQAAQKQPLQSKAEQLEQPPQEIGDHGFHEADGKAIPAEADHTAVRVTELEGDMYRPSRR